MNINNDHLEPVYVSEDFDHMQTFLESQRSEDVKSLAAEKEKRILADGTEIMEIIFPPDEKLSEAIAGLLTEDVAHHAWVLAFLIKERVRAWAMQEAEEAVKPVEFGHVLDMQEDDDE